MKHVHHDLIVQWANDPSVPVWYFSTKLMKWGISLQPLWLQDEKYYLGHDDPNEPTPKQKLDALLDEGNHVLCWVWIDEVNKMLRVITSRVQDHYLTSENFLWKHAEICTNYPNLPDGILGKPESLENKQ